MFVERFISYFAYYTIPLLWGLYLKWYMFPFGILMVWHYWFYGLAIRASSDAVDRLSSAEYSYWLPLTGSMALYIGYAMSKAWNFNRMLFVKKFDEYLCWILVASVNFVTFHAVVGIWEFGGRFDPPVSYWITFGVQVALLAVWSFVNSRFDWFFMHEYVNAKGETYLSDSDSKFTKFTIAHIVLTVSTTVIFAIVRGVAPGFWPFWIVLITFGFHLILVIVSARVTRKRLGHNPGVFFDSLAATYSAARGALPSAMGLPKDAFSSAPGGSATTTRRISGSDNTGNAMEMAPLNGTEEDRDDVEEGAKSK